jgi:hypothetical protein
MHEWQRLQQRIDEEFKRMPRNNALIEMLEATYFCEWQKFEDMVWMQCKLPRNELLVKRYNDTRRFENEDIGAD